MQIKIENTYSENNCPDSVVKSGRAHGFLVSLGSTSLIRQDEAGTDPDSRSTQHKGRSDRLAIEQASGSNNLHRLARQGALVALDQLGNSGNEDGRGNITRVSTTFTTLGADDVGAHIQSLLNVFRVTDHVHVENAGGVELLHNMLGRHTDGGDKQLGTALDDDVNQLVELAFGVVIAKQRITLAWNSSLLDGAT